MFRILIQFDPEWDKKSEVITGRVLIGEKNELKWGSANLEPIVEVPFEARPGSFTWKESVYVELVMPAKSWGLVPDRLRVEAQALVEAYIKGMTNDCFIVAWDYCTGDKSIVDCLTPRS